MTSSDSDASSESSADESSPPQVITASELMRQKLQSKNTDRSDRKPKKNDDVDLDDEIKRLEAELAQGSDDSDSESDSDDDSGSIESANEERRKRIRFGEATILNPQDVVAKKSKQDDAAGVICISECASETIAPLPKNSLPTNKTKKLKIDLEGNDKKDGRKRKRRDEQDGAINDGLRDAVKEVLSGYVARSSEKLPFYCRVCLHQSQDAEDFIAHKMTEFHKTAVQMEKKATFCKLCRKQLTSLVQMQEHLDSRPHRDKMDQAKAYQRGGPMNGGFRPGRGSGGRGGRESFGGRGPGRGGRWQGRGGGSQSDKRQWC